MEAKMERFPFRNAAKTVSRRAGRKTNQIPWIVALTFGVFWSATYLLLGRMHGMWPMFNSEFPFSTAHLFISRIAELPTALGALFAFLDGAVAGFAGGWIILLAARINSEVGR